MGYSVPSTAHTPSPPRLKKPISRRSRKNWVPKLCQTSMPLSRGTVSFTGMIPTVTIRSTWEYTARTASGWYRSWMRNSSRSSWVV